MCTGTLCAFLLSFFFFFLEQSLVQSHGLFILFIHMNTCWAPHLEMPVPHNGNCHAILCVCTLVVCHSKWVTVALHRALWISTEVVTKMPEQNCCHPGTSSVYTIQPYTSSQCHFIWSHIYRMHVCLPATYTIGRMTSIIYVLLCNMGVEQIPK